MIRKRNDSVKDGRGYDGSKGQNWSPHSDLSKQFNTGDDHGERDYSRNAQNTGPKSGDKWAETGSQWGPGEGRHDYNAICSDGDFGQRAGARDIFDEAFQNSYASPDGSSWYNASGGRTGPVKFGVNMSQTKGSKKISHE
jgi:hypothetical protein